MPFSLNDTKSTYSVTFLISLGLLLYTISEKTEWKHTTFLDIILSTL